MVDRSTMGFPGGTFPGGTNKVPSPRLRITLPRNPNDKRTPYAPGDVEQTARDGSRYDEKRKMMVPARNESG
jgi:hypothetical protein